MNAESKCPMGGNVSRSAVVRSMSNQLWWPNRLDLSILRQNSPLTDPMGTDFDYAGAFKSLDLKAVKADIFALMTTLAGLVAGRLRPLRPAVHPDGVAQRGHLPHQRRPRRCRPRYAALRAAQQLARQCEPRQGAPVALADQAEIRPEALLGRPDDPGRELCPGVDGLQDGRFRRRSRGRLGAAGRHLLGP